MPYQRNSGWFDSTWYNPAPLRNPDPPRCSYKSNNEGACGEYLTLDPNPDKDKPSTRYEGPPWCAQCQKQNLRERKIKLLELFVREARETLLKKKFVRRWKNHILKNGVGARKPTAPEKHADIEGLYPDSEDCYGPSVIRSTIPWGCVVFRAASYKPMSGQVRKGLTNVADKAPIKIKRVRWRDPVESPPPRRPYVSAHRIVFGTIRRRRSSVLSHFAAFTTGRQLSTYSMFFKYLFSISKPAILWCTNRLRRVIWHVKRISGNHWLVEVCCQKANLGT